MLDHLYIISSGLYKTPHGTYLGYSGAPGYINDVNSTNLRSLGPIPPGVYRIGKPFHHRVLGPISMRLNPVGHNAIGRSGFFIHGDNQKGNRSASSGCIILPRSARIAISSYSPTNLRVAESEENCGGTGGASQPPGS